MKNVVFLGGRKLGFKLLKWLIHTNNNVVAVCPTVEKELDPFYDKIIEVSNDNNVQIVNLNSLANISCDVGFCVNYDRIIPESVIKLFSLGIYNIHHSYNLRLKGRNITTHVILNSKKDKIFYHGTTIHKVVKELDSGGIVASIATPIYNYDTSYSLFNRVDDLAYNLAKEWFPRIMDETVVLYNPPNDLTRSFKFKDLPSKEIKNGMGEELTFDIIRAFDFEGQERAYIFFENIKKELSIYKSNDFDSPIHINGKCYYTKIN